MAEIGQVRPSIPSNWPSQSNVIKPAEQQRRNPNDKSKREGGANTGYDDNEDESGHIDEYA